MKTSTFIVVLLAMIYPAASFAVDEYRCSGKPTRVAQTSAAYHQMSTIPGVVGHVLWVEYAAGQCMYKPHGGIYEPSDHTVYALQENIGLDADPTAPGDAGERHIANTRLSIILSALGTGKELELYGSYLGTTTGATARRVFRIGYVHIKL